MHMNSGVVGEPGSSPTTGNSEMSLHGPITPQHQPGTMQDAELNKIMQMLQFNHRNQSAALGTSADMMCKMSCDMRGGNDVEYNKLNSYPSDNRIDRVASSYGELKYQTSTAGSISDLRLQQQQQMMFHRGGGHAMNPVKQDNGELLSNNISNGRNGMYSLDCGNNSRRMSVGELNEPTGYRWPDGSRDGLSLNEHQLSHCDSCLTSSGVKSDSIGSTDSFGFGVKCSPTSAAQPKTSSVFSHVATPPPSQESSKWSGEFMHDERVTNCSLADVKFNFNSSPVDVKFKFNSSPPDVKFNFDAAAAVASQLTPSSYGDESRSSGGSPTSSWGNMDDGATAKYIEWVIDQARMPQDDERVAVMKMLIRDTTAAHLSTCLYTSEKFAKGLQEYNEIKLRAGDDYEKNLDLDVMWQHFVNNMSPVIQRVVKFSKKLTGFSDIGLEDQMKLIKQGCFEVVVTRYTLLFTDTGLFVPSMTIKIPREQVIRMPMGAFFEEQYQFANVFNKLKLTDVEIGILCAAMIICPERASLERAQDVRDLYILYLQSLYIVMKYSRPDTEEMERLFRETISVLPLLHIINDKHAKSLNSLKVGESGEAARFPPLHEEVFGNGGE